MGLVLIPRHFVERAKTSHAKTRRREGIDVARFSFATFAASRDRSFLGTVGLFDELILPLKRGDNELQFAVSEGFGGWAVVAQLP
jgi:hypothetical protein